MKDQRKQSEKRFGWRLLSVVLLVVTLSVLALTISVSAAGQKIITVKNDDIQITTTGVTLQNGEYTKTYDGNTDVTAVFKTGFNIEKIDAADDVTLSIVSAAYNSADVSEAKQIVVEFALSGADAYKYTVGNISLPARITPIKLEWAEGGYAQDSVVYDPTVSVIYPALSAIEASLPDWKDAGLSNATIQSLRNGMTVTSVKPFAGTTVSGSPYETTAIVNLANANYTLDPVPVKVMVTKRTITKIEWLGNPEWTYGDKMPITVRAYDKDGNPFDVLDIVCDGSLNVKDVENFAKGNVGSYTLLAVLNDTVNFKLGTTNEAVASKGVVIQQKNIKVTMADLTIVGDEKTEYRLTVAGELPEEVLNAIVYKVNGETFTGTSAYGTYTVTAILPVGNYSFSTDGKADISELTATLTIKVGHKIFPVLDAEGNTVGNVILSNPNGFDKDLQATVTAIEGYPSIVKNNRYNQTFKITVTGAADGETFTLLIPIIDDVIAPRTDKLTLEDLCLYEAANGTLTAAVNAGKGYTVTLGKGFYQVENFQPAGEITFVISPDYHAPFFYTAIGIIILVLLVLAILLLLCYIGLFLRKNLTTRQNPMVVVDTDGVFPPYTPDVIQVPEREPLDEEAMLEETLDNMAEGMEVEAADIDAVEADEDEVRAETEDAMQELQDEVDGIELEVEDEATEEPAEEAAEETEEVAEEVVDEIVEETTAEVIAEVIEEVAEEAAEEVTEEAVEETAEEEVAEEAVEEVTEEAAEEAAEEIAEEATEEEAVEEAAEEEVVEEPVEEETVEEPVEEVVEEPVAEEAAEQTEDEDDNDDDDNDDDNDDDAAEASADPFGFADSAADPSTFIDVKENPEAYQEMLERERRGEIRIVSRYKKSFAAKLAQSMGNVQDYYSELKNALLSYKGVKNRMSWNYEAFNKGRTHVAKMIAKARTLYVYLAINPEELVDTKYTFVDVSSKKKYATTPVLMKVKGERKFKHTLELIEKICGEQLQLVRLENEPTDYRIPRMTIEELIEAGYIKHNAGYIPLTEEAVAVSADATEEVAAEEVATEEVVAEEATEEVPAEEATEEVPAEEVTEEVPAEEAAEEIPAEEVTEEVPAEEEPKQE